jgi:hypothetical protein
MLHFIRLSPVNDILLNACPYQCYSCVSYRPKIPLFVGALGISSACTRGTWRFDARNGNVRSIRRIFCLLAGARQKHIPETEDGLPAKRDDEQYSVAKRQAEGELR